MNFPVKRDVLCLLLALSLCVASGCSAKGRDVDSAQGAADKAGVSAGQPAISAAESAPAKVPENSPEKSTDDETLDDSDFGDFGDAPAGASAVAVDDPFESWNRMWFAVNDFIYIKILKPTYRGYGYVMPSALRSGLSNALRNFQAPVRIVNSILQLNFPQAVVEYGRFVVNTIVGGLGLAEVIKPEAAYVPMDLENANFNGTLAKWGMGEGAYLVWPILGPSTVRNSLGMAGDMFSGFSFWLSKPIGPLDEWLGYGAQGLYFNQFGSLVDNYETLTKAAIEPYAALRDAYMALRYGRKMPAPPVEPIMVHPITP